MDMESTNTSALMLSVRFNLILTMQFSPHDYLWDRVYYALWRGMIYTILADAHLRIPRFFDWASISRDALGGHHVSYNTRISFWCNGFD